MHQKRGGVYVTPTTSQKPSFVMSLDVLSHPFYYETAHVIINSVVC